MQPCTMATMYTDGCYADSPLRRAQCNGALSRQCLPRSTGGTQAGDGDGPRTGVAAARVDPKPGDRRAGWPAGRLILTTLGCQSLALAPSGLAPHSPLCGELGWLRSPSFFATRLATSRPVASAVIPPRHSQSVSAWRPRGVVLGSVARPQAGRASSPLQRWTASPTRAQTATGVIAPPFRPHASGSFCSVDPIFALCASICGYLGLRRLDIRAD